LNKIIYLNNYFLSFIVGIITLLCINNILTVNEYFTNGYNVEILNILSIFVILSSIFVIIVKNPIISVLFLIGLFAGISAYLIILGISFIGLSYLIVYIGAVSILFLFILMLINIRISELQSNTNNSIPLAVIITIIFNYTLFQLLPYDIAILNNYSSYLNNMFYTIFYKKDYIQYYLNNQQKDNDILFVTGKT
jgi:NADH-ubiquinone oxidoreductase chain 6